MNIIKLIFVLVCALSLGNPEKVTSTTTKVFENPFEEDTSDWCCSCCGAKLDCSRNVGNATVVYDKSPSAKETFSRFNVSVVPEMRRDKGSYTCCCCCGQCLQCMRQGGWD